MKVPNEGKEEIMSQKKPPNILLFFTDDQRFDAVGALGGTVRTPNLDRLIARGTTFTHAHIPCGTHGAICMPSRAMLHTGRTLFHLHDSGSTIPAEHTMLGEALRGRGYSTWGAGKWHNGRESFNRGFDSGDEIYFGGMADHWNVPAYHYDESGKYDARLAYIPDPPSFGNNDIAWRDCDHIHAGRHSSEVLADAVIDHINGIDPQSDKPFFAYVALLAPHDPRTMPQRFLDMYPRDDVALPPNFVGGHPFDNGSLRIRDEMLARFPRTPEEIRRHIAEYYAMVSHLDHEFGRVMAALDANGLADDTLIVFAGDNGLAVGQHGLMGKQNCYEHSVRVPLVFAGPGIPQGVRSSAYVYLLDIFPTLCELTGTTVPKSVEGESLVAALNDPTATVRDCRRQTQLFDLRDDPWETRNLFGEPGTDAVVADLREEMQRYRQQWERGHTERSARFWERYGQ